MKLIFIVTAAGAFATSLATTANADPAWQEPMVSEQVSFADLNLGSSHDQQRLRDRISFAAYRLCLVDPGASPSPAFADAGCFRWVVSDGLAQMVKAVAAAENHQTLASATLHRR
ncbi:MAG TPA: UrcA family protein [Sphingomicrobium sp.]|nr:UrcA family protein [Sphingomicrobium sp.]